MKFLIIWILYSQTSFAQSAKPYAEADVTSIFATVRHVVSASDEALASSNKGPYQAQLLWSAGGAPPFIGHGQTTEEAEVRASFLCIKWKCSVMDAERNATVARMADYPPEKLMDVLRAAGRLDLIPNNPNVDKEEFKKKIILKLQAENLSCENDALKAEMAYVMCTGAGYREPSEPIK